MAVPSSQLITWSRQPDAGRSASTYDSVKKALAASDALHQYSYDVYLQGSYANATNIRADSDVDVVAELTSMFNSNLGALSVEERSRFSTRFSDSSLTLAGFRRDVLAALRSYYGAASVTEGNKCLKVAGTSNRLPADVLPANQYRLWRQLPAYGDPSYVSGILFVTRDGREVINYPKEHRNNGQDKHGKTSNQYKPLVRTVKNARRKLVEDGVITRDVSPSYFVECLLYNVPNPNFTGDLSRTYLNMLNWLHENQGSLAGLWCQNGVTQLFGSAPEQWDTGRAVRLINALIAQWNDWGK